MKNFMLYNFIIIIFYSIICCGQTEVQQSKTKVYYNYSNFKTRDTSINYLNKMYSVFYKIYPAGSNDYIKTTHSVNNQKLENRFVNNRIDIIIKIDGKIIFKKTMAKKDFSSIIFPKYFKKSILTHIDFLSVSDAGATFIISFCIPDTDLDTDIEFVISNKGIAKMKKIEIIEDL